MRSAEKGRTPKDRTRSSCRRRRTRAAALTHGFPARREDLYAYDGLIIANVEGDFFTRAQLTMAADFVVGARWRTAGRGRAIVRAARTGGHAARGRPAGRTERSARRDWRGLVRPRWTARRSNKVIVTAEGARHPAMRIGATPQDTQRLWAALPALAWSAPLGGPRPGASVLAVTSSATGASPIRSWRFNGTDVDVR